MMTKQAPPKMHYRTRDITRLGIAPCECGRRHVRSLRITGSYDLPIIRRVNVQSPNSGAANYSLRPCYLWGSHHVHAC